MNNSDFLRQLPGGAGPMHSQRSLSQRLRIDPILLVLLLILSGVGLAVLYSASDENSAVVLRQGRFLSVAFVVMLLVAQLHAEQLQRWAPFAFAGVVILLLAVDFVGVGAKGAQRWLSLGGASNGFAKPLGC